MDWLRPPLCLSLCEPVLLKPLPECLFFAEKKGLSRLFSELFVKSGVQSVWDTGAMSPLKQSAHPEAEP